MSRPSITAGIILLIMLVILPDVHAQHDELRSAHTPLNGNVLKHLMAEQCSAYPTKPSAGNTGHAGLNLLSAYTGSRKITTDGTIIDGKIIDGSVTIDGADNVQIRNSLILGNGGHYALHITNDAQNFLIEDVEVTDARSSIIYVTGGSGGVIRRAYLHESEGDAMKTTGANGVLVEASYFAPTIGSAEGAHADGNQTRSGHNLTFMGNTFDMPVPATSPYKSNANFIIQADAGNISNVHIACNWLNGGNYTVYFLQDKNNLGYRNTDARLIYNRFGKAYRYGVYNQDEMADPDVCGNIWEENGTLMDINNNEACLDQTIPVELTSLEARINEQEVIIDWNTASEINNAGFEIQRKSPLPNDKEHWIRAGFVEGAGTTTLPLSYQFADPIADLLPGRIDYRLKQIDFDGTYAISEVVTVEIPVTAGATLYPSFPNPFNPSTQVQFEIPVDTYVEVSLTTVTGQRVQTLTHQWYPAGRHAITLDAKNLSSGTYLVTMRAGSVRQSHSLVLMK